MRISFLPSSPPIQATRQHWAEFQQGDFFFNQWCHTSLITTRGVMCLSPVIIKQDSSQWLVVRWRVSVWRKDTGVSVVRFQVQWLRPRNGMWVGMQIGNSWGCPCVEPGHITCVMSRLMTQSNDSKSCMMCQNHLGRLISGTCPDLVICWEIVWQIKWWI